ncbi:MAG: bifunctional YncE family protein/alkaline phosphatase family protein [Acidobacteriia bacterium]|nr:bifunctional YncE family protein/alkaline phosphatase family protein [Terriglobia bacterium]
MKKITILSLAVVSAVLLFGQIGIRVAPQSRLFNGWGLSPAGEPIELPADMPTRILISPDSKTLFVNSTGFNEHGVAAIDLATRRVVQHVDLLKSWIGMADLGDGRILASGGGPMPAEPKTWGVRSGISPAVRERLKDPAYLLEWRDKKLSFAKGIALPPSAAAPRFISGVAKGRDGSVYVLDAGNDTVFRLSGDDFQVQASGPAGYRPYEIAVGDGVVAVSNWGEGSVSLLDPDTLRERARIPAGKFPNQLLFAPDGRLFVANSGSNTVSVIAGNRVIETIDVALRPGSPIGSTTDALAINPAGSRLLAANADNNDVAMVDISNRARSTVMGFIPTAWYPTAVAVSPDGKDLYIGAGKGLGIGANVPFIEQAYRLGRPPENNLDNPKIDSKQYNYLGTLLRGFVYTMRVPDARELQSLTARVRANHPEPKKPEPSIQEAALSKIKHVVYIIRENRTYDQVFGDISRGNGDPNLVLFGAEATPNAHHLATDYVLFDNFYANGDVSWDGHEWCDYAYATDYTQRFWMYTYSGRSGLPQDGRLRGLPGSSLWELAGRFGLDYRNYGEGRGRPSETLSALGPRRRDTDRVGAFIEEMKKAETTGDWPALLVMSLPGDHTQGMLPNAYSPVAMVADNDLALGRLVEAVSQSRFWKETAILVVEDDAQDGPDHVDAHRTVALAISPYIKRHFVDHTQYTQVSLVRTIETILGLPSLTQYDEAAVTLENDFTREPDFSPYTAIVPRVNMEARNPKSGVGAVASLRLDFSDVDRADPTALNEILWNALRAGKPVPPPVHSMVFASHDDDDEAGARTHKYK